MALSKQVTPARNLNAFMRWAHAAGYRVGEHPSFGGVTPGVHAPGSWHDDGLATDINWGVGNPPDERGRLLVALEVGESMGLAVTFARDGVVGSADNHRGHLHADVGEWSNYGKGPVRRTAGDLVVFDLQRAVFRDTARWDNLWGPNTGKRLESVRLASELHGPRFPHGRRYVQRVIGVDDDGVWGPDSRARHDEVVGDIQAALRVADDGVWGPDTEGAYQQARKRYQR